MKQLRYDTVLKDMFERDRPSLLNELAGGVPIRGFLNVELPKMIDRRVDCVAELENGKLFHLEFQSQNHRKMAHRQGIYGLLLSDKFHKKVEQTVLYTGQAPLSMSDSLDAGTVQVHYRLVDIRQFRAEDLLRSSNPADRALAILGAGAAQKVREVVGAALAGPASARDRAASQLTILAGLRRLERRVTMELNSMSVYVTPENNYFVRQIHERAMAKGKAEGKAEGKVEIFRMVLEGKFGRLPDWASKRIVAAKTAQLDRWVRKLATADTLEAVLGRRA